ncbi:MAG: hypothetical protein QOI82_1593 [Actinomycetota bacterium]|jgi:hypothetical protein|nr:hypothetical protein [Actinomycetota bacterium]
MPATAASSPPRVGACNPGLGIGLADVPGSVRDPRARAYVVNHVEAGARFTRRFRVCNGTQQPITVKLYAGAAAISGGAFTIAEGRVENDVSSWITVAPAAVTVPSGQERFATATFVVPSKVSGGERYAVILAELPARPTSSGVAVASRVGIRVYLDVGGPQAPKSDFTVDTLQASRRSDGTAVVTAQVHNIGARALDMRGSLTLRDGPDGLSAGPYPATLGTTLAPGQTEPVTVVLGKSITGGPWTARLTLTSGLLERRAEAKLTFPDAAGAVAPPVRAKSIPLAKDRRVLIPLATGLIGILLLLLWFFWFFAKKRSRRRETDEEVDARRAAQ